VLEVLLGILILLKIIFGTVIVHEVKKPQTVIIRPYSEFFDTDDNFTEDDFEEEEESDISK